MFQFRGVLCNVKYKLHELAPLFVPCILFPPHPSKVTHAILGDGERGISTTSELLARSGVDKLMTTSASSYLAHRERKRRILLLRTLNVF